MIRQWVTGLTGVLCVTACTPAETTSTGVVDDDLGRLLAENQVFYNARLWDGVAENYIENAVLVVRQGRILSVFSADSQPLPEGVEGVDLGGQFVIPGLINAHGHVGMADGLETGSSVYSEELVERQLKTYAHYGITSVVSLGDEPPEAFTVRDRVVAENPAMARLWVAGDVLNPASADDAAAAVDAAADTDPDWVKIRVDDQLGRQEAMPFDIYQAIISRSHEHELPLASHMVTLEDSKGLMRAGSDLLAHSVRDAEVDDELIDLMMARDICVTPTLTREVSTYVYGSRPDFFDDEFFTQTADSEVVEQLLRDEVQARFRGRDADYYRDALPLAKQNMIRMFEAGIGVAMGTDSGPPARFQGYFEHMEMEMMENAGMTAKEVLLSATQVAARCMSLDDELGTLQPGRWADFLVLADDPMESTRNLRSIEAVYLAGERFESPFSYTHR